MISSLFGLYQRRLENKEMSPPCPLHVNTNLSFDGMLNTFPDGCI